MHALSVLHCGLLSLLSDNLSHGQIQCSALYSCLTQPVPFRLLSTYTSTL